MKKIPLCIPAIGEEEIQAVARVLTSGWLAHGEMNHEFERLFQEYIGCRHAVTLNSCTSALYLALLAQGIRGEVITPSFTFVATVNAIALAGATPVFVDIDPGTRTVPPAAVEQAITARTEAVMVVHYGGLPADMPQFDTVARRHGLALIEDSAECLGGSCAGRKAGSFGTGCFSFFPTKNVATGEGGMLTTDDEALAARVRALSAHGIYSTTATREKQSRPWARTASMFGHNFRMSNVLAAIGVEQMKKLDRLNGQRQALAARYMDNLRDVAGVSGQTVPEGFANSWQMFTILVPARARDALLDHLRANGIGASVHFDPPVHLQPPYREFRISGSLAHTEAVAASIVTLPLFPAMTAADVDYVSEAVRGFAGSFS